MFERDFDVISSGYYGNRFVWGEVGFREFFVDVWRRIVGLLKVVLMGLGRRWR